MGHGATSLSSQVLKQCQEGSAVISRARMGEDVKKGTQTLGRTAKSFKRHLQKGVCWQIEVSDRETFQTVSHAIAQRFEQTQHTNLCSGMKSYKILAEKQVILIDWKDVASYNAVYSWLWLSLNKKSRMAFASLARGSAEASRTGCHAKAARSFHSSICSRRGCPAKAASCSHGSVCSQRGCQANGASRSRGSVCSRGGCRAKAASSSHSSQNS